MQILLPHNEVINLLPVTSQLADGPRAGKSNEHSTFIYSFTVCDLGPKVLASDVIDRHA
jgi:hypothetical protein